MRPGRLNSDPFTQDKALNLEARVCVLSDPALRLFCPRAWNVLEASDGMYVASLLSRRRSSVRGGPAEGSGVEQYPIEVL